MVQLTTLLQEVIIEKEPILGLLSISGYVEDVVGVTSVKQLQRSFRYCKDGVNFSDWIELTNENLQALTFEKYNIVVFHFLYKRIGSDDTGTIDIEDLDIIGDYEVLSNGSNFANSIFGKFFDSFDTKNLGWAVNVLQKIYHPGILPKFIIRNEDNNEQEEDKDFLAFWFTVTHFFSFFVQYARILENFPSYKQILSEYLKQQNLFFSNDDSIEDLNILMNNYYAEIAQRGTIGIIREKGKDGALINGELLRLINNKPNDEFIFGFSPIEKIGWNLGNSSPLNRRVPKSVKTTKAYEGGKYPTDLTKYPLTGSNYGLGTMLGNPSIRMGISSGFDFDNNISKAVNINPNLDYEISCYILADSTNPTIDFGVNVFNSDNELIEIKEIDTLNNNSLFLNDFKLQKHLTFYRLVGILYNKNQTVLTGSNSKLNIGFGKKLRLTSNSAKIIPKLKNVGTGNLYIYDFKIKPLRSNFSTGFIQSNNFIQTWLINNNSEFSIENIEDIIREYLIPYNIWMKINNLETPLSIVTNY